MCGFLSQCLVIQEITTTVENGKIWCSPLGGDALQYLMQLVTTPDTDCYFLSPLCSGTHCSISVSHMSVELVHFVCLILCSYTHLLKINAVDSERTFLFLLSLFELQKGQIASAAAVSVYPIGTLLTRLH